jgi:hypothetical protein
VSRNRALFALAQNLYQEEKYGKLIEDVRRRTILENFEIFSLIQNSNLLFPWLLSPQVLFFDAHSQVVLD